MAAMESSKRANPPGGLLLKPRLSFLFSKQVVYPTTSLVMAAMAWLERAKNSETAPGLVFWGGLQPKLHNTLASVSSKQVFYTTTSFGTEIVSQIVPKAPKAITPFVIVIQKAPTVLEALQPVKGLSGASPRALRDQLAVVKAASLWARRKLSNQGESSGSGSGSGSGGRAGGERNGGEGDGNQGIGGGGQREGIGNERGGYRGRNHGGGNGNGNGDDDGNDRRGWLGYVGGERGPMGPGPYGLAEILPFLNVQMIGTLTSLDIHGLPARAMIYRVVSLGFNSVALVCVSASIGRRRTSPRLASMLCLIAASATLMGFIFMIAMAVSASFIP